MPEAYQFKFTVFTATFNRRHLLGRIYECLKTQTFKDFEWVIVDDGSTDNTGELAQAWIKENLFPIKYFWQENSGKQAAFSRGIKEAKGEFFLNIDSDDYCKPGSMEILNRHWENIPVDERPSFAGVYCNCVDEGGKVIGSEFPQAVLDSRMFDIFYKYKVTGDKWGFFKTEVLKEFPFPVIKGEKLFPDGAIWNRISLRYLIRFVNEGLLIVNYQKDGQTSQSLLLRVKNPLGAIMYYREFLLLPVPLYWRLRNLVNYSRFCFHAKKGFALQIKDLPNLVWKIALVPIIPMSFMVYIIDCKRIKSQ